MKLMVRNQRFRPNLPILAVVVVWIVGIPACVPAQDTDATPADQVSSSQNPSAEREGSPGELSEEEGIGEAAKREASGASSGAAGPGADEATVEKPPAPTGAEPSGTEEPPPGETAEPAIRAEAASTQEAAPAESEGKPAEAAAEHDEASPSEAQEAAAEASESGATSPAPSAPPAAEKEPPTSAEKAEVKEPTRAVGPPEPPQAESPPAETAPPSAPPQTTPQAETAPEEAPARPGAEAPAPAEPAKPPEAAGLWFMGPQGAEEPGPEPPAREPEAVAREVPPPPVPQGEVKLRFNFRFQPWEDVLDWFAQQAGLSLVYESLPTGTFNYTDDREYTPAEAIDLINSVLQLKGYMLVRRDRMLILVNTEDGVPPNLVNTIPLEELDRRGEYELVSVLFDLQSITPEEAQEEIQKLIGPQGSVVPLPKSGQLWVTETAGRLRTIRRVIQRIEDPAGLASAKLQTFELKYASAEEAMLVLRSLLDIPEDSNKTSDGSLHLATDAFGTKIFATGKPEMLARVAEILEKIDIQGPFAEEEGGVAQAPQLEVYPVGSADPATVLAVMQTLLQGRPDVRLATDPKTGSLVALGRPNDHATIRATLQQLEQEAAQVEVIQLHQLDPEVALIAINKLFGATGEGGSGAPSVDADPVTRQLLVRGTPTQIQQIRGLLEKMGESASEAGRLAQRGGNVRMLPLTGRAARTALERIEKIWPAIRRNRIRVVTPSAVIPTLRPGSRGPGRGPKESPEIPPEVLRQLFGPAGGGQLRRQTPSGPAGPAPDSPSNSPPSNNSTQSLRRAPFRLVSEPQEGSENVTAPKPQAASPGASHRAETSPSDQPAAPKEPPPIIVAPGPGGVMIASDDIEALNEFEDLLTALASGAAEGNTDLTVFYLKHVRATVAAQLLDQIFGGGTLVGGSSGGRSMLGEMANAALGETAGGLVSSLFGLRGGEGTITPSGAILITPDERLNALFIQATPKDLDTIEQLLEILDQRESPEEVLAKPQPRLIPLYNTQAEEVAEIVRQVYQDRLISGGQGQQQGRPSPEQIMEFIRRIRGGSGGRSSRQTTQQDRMAIGVDTRTNSLVVVAPDALFREVKQLVETLDQAAIQNGQAVRVVRLKRASPEVVEEALANLTGGAVQVRRQEPGAGPRPTGVAGRPTAASPRGPSPGSRPSPEQIEQFRRRIEFFRRMREQGGFGGFRGGGPRPGGSPGRPPSRGR